MRPTAAQLATLLERRSQEHQRSRGWSGSGIGSSELAATDPEGRYLQDIGVITVAWFDVFAIRPQRMFGHSGVLSVGTPWHPHRALQESWKAKPTSWMPPASACPRNTL